MKPLLIVLFAFFMAACTSNPVMNVNDAFVPSSHSGAKPSLESVEKAILTATQRRGWSSRIVRPGLIEATVSVRAHRATIEIPYTDATYSILYKDSDNLNFDGDSIHRNYNNWILKLHRTIQAQLGVNSQHY